MKEWPYKITIAFTIVSSVGMFIGMLGLIVLFHFPTMLRGKDLFYLIQRRETLASVFNIIIKDVVLWLPLLTFIVSSFGTLAGVIFAWRADRRHARELELRVSELETKLLESATENQKIIVPSDADIAASNAKKNR